MLLQVDRQDLSAGTEQWRDQARFSEGTIKALKQINFKEFKDKLLLHQDPKKDPMTPEFETAILTKIVEALNRCPKGTLIGCTKAFLKNKDQMDILWSASHTLLAEHASQDFHSVFSVESYTGAMQMYHV